MQVPKKMGVELVDFDDFRPGLYREGRYREAMQVTADHYRPMVKNYTGLYLSLIHIWPRPATTTAPCCWIPTRKRSAGI